MVSKQEEKTIYERADTLGVEFRGLWDKIDCNNFKDSVPEEHKEEMYQIISMMRTTCFKLEDWKEKLKWYQNKKKKYSNAKIVK